MKTTTNRHSETLQESELVLNKDGSVYHLHLKPEHIADTVLLVGDQGRVEQISNKFDTIEFSIQNREFCTTTGSYKGKRITALSTGIGTDNISYSTSQRFNAFSIGIGIPHIFGAQSSIIEASEAHIKLTEHQLLSEQEKLYNDVQSSFATKYL